MPDARWESANKALTALGRVNVISAEEAATAILNKASDKLIPVVNDLIAEYQLDQIKAALSDAAEEPGRCSVHREENAYTLPDSGQRGRHFFHRRRPCDGPRGGRAVIPNPSEEEIARLRREAVSRPYAWARMLRG
jgi:hypothetical protein